MLGIQEPLHWAQQKTRRRDLLEVVVVRVHRAGHEGQAASSFLREFESVTWFLFLEGQLENGGGT